MLRALEGLGRLWERSRRVGVTGNREYNPGWHTALDLHDLQDMMQDLVGIVRREDEMLRALDGLQQFWERARRVGVTGNREYNPGWHTALDLPNLLTVSEAICRAGLRRKESRGGHFRDDYSDKSAYFAKVNVVVRPGRDGRMEVDEVPIPEMPAELKQIIEEMK